MSDSNLVSLKEASLRLGFGESTIQQYKSRYPDHFPQPVPYKTGYKGRPLYHINDITEFLEKKKEERWEISQKETSSVPVAKPLTVTPETVKQIPVDTTITRTIVTVVRIWKYDVLKITTTVVSK